MLQDTYDGTFSLSRSSDDGLAGFVNVSKSLVRLSMMTRICVASDSVIRELGCLNCKEMDDALDACFTLFCGTVFVEFWPGIHLRAGFGYRLKLGVVEEGWRPFRPNVLVLSMPEGGFGVREDRFAWRLVSSVVGSGLGPGDDQLVWTILLLRWRCGMDLNG